MYKSNLLGLGLLDELADALVLVVAVLSGLDRWHVLPDLLADLLRHRVAAVLVDLAGSLVALLLRGAMAVGLGEAVAVLAAVAAVVRAVAAGLAAAIAGVAAVAGVTAVLVLEKKETVKITAIWKLKKSYLGRGRSVDGGGLAVDGE